MIRILLFSLIMSFFLVKSYAQNAISVNPISVGFVNQGQDSLHFSMVIVANEEALTVGWKTLKLHEQSIEITPDLAAKYDGTSSLNNGESVEIRISISKEEMGIPVTLLVHLIATDRWVKIPIPYQFQINEIDIDTQGSDTQEFLEILAPAIPFASLNGIEITAINGSNESVSRRWNISEDAHIANESGLFLLAGRDLTIPTTLQFHSFMSTSNLFQNGSSKADEADAISINWVIDDLDQHIVLDALIYDTNANSSDAGLAELLEMDAKAAIEGLTLDKENSSLQRTYSQISSVKNVTHFVEGTPTPGQKQAIMVGSQSNVDQWLMLGLPEGVTISDWVNASFYTQGATGADIEEGDPIAFYWENGSFIPIQNLNQELPSHKGFFIYVTEQTYGYGVDGWPKPLGFNLNKALTIDLESPKNIPLNINGEGADRGLNLVSNPFPLPIDIQPILENNPSVLSVSKWNAVSKEYEVWNGVNGDLETTIIQPYEGFWLKVNEETSVTIEPAANLNSTNKEMQFAINDQRTDKIATQLSLNLTGTGIDQKVIIASLNELTNTTFPAAEILYQGFDAEQKVKFYLEEVDSATALKLAYVSTHEWQTNFEVELVVESKTAIQDLTVSLSNKLVANFDAQLIDQATKSVVAQERPQRWVLPNLAPKKNRFSLILTRLKTTNISEELVPNKFILHQNYPNPFNPSTTIPIQLSSANFLQLEIYDSLGRIIHKVSPKYYSKGIHNVNVTAGASWKTGVYFYRISLQNGQAFQRKMLFIK